MRTPSQIPLGAKGRWLGVVTVCSSLPVPQPSATFWDFLFIFCFQQAGHSVLNSLLVVALLTAVMEREERFFFLPPNLGMFYHSTLIPHLSLKKTNKKTQTIKPLVLLSFMYVCISLCGYLPASEPEEGFRLLGARCAGHWEQPGWCWELNPSIPHRWPALQPPKHSAFMWISCCVSAHSWLNLGLLV